jgi:tRNA U34 5-methylaminomethyl-2-thiouridine-forming methyltransferase MnmC
MDREIILTRDGSHSVSVTGTEVSYHSRFGAITESSLVYIAAGLRYALLVKPRLVIFELGFGTGLNALLSLIEIEQGDQEISYRAIEPFPLPDPFIFSLNYCTRLQRPDLQEVFVRMHQVPWDRPVTVTPRFHLEKWVSVLESYDPGEEKVDLVYYDAFSPNEQPGLWTGEAFGKIFAMMSDGAVLVTYCSKGEVRRRLQACGFLVEKLPGPPGKREMIRAIKPGLLARG